MQGWGHVHNVYQGIFWFILPCSLVIINDIFAYVFGSVFGRTPLGAHRRSLQHRQNTLILIPLLGPVAASPNKTWEGFVGGGFMTLVLALGITHLVCICAKPQVWLCPQLRLTAVPFEELDKSCPAAEQVCA